MGEAQSVNLGKEAYEKPMRVRYRKKRTRRAAFASSGPNARTKAAGVARFAL